MMPTNEEQLAILKDRQGREVALKGVKTHARLQGLLAEVEVEQSYRNPRDTNIEAVYTFPLPFGAVLLALEVEIAGKTLSGQVVEKKEAERRYEDAVTDGDSAVMLEEADPGLYTASLGNLMAGETAVIRYRYGLPLNWQGDRLRFLLPTTIAPRYGDAEAAGLQAHQVPEAALDVEYPLELTVDVEGDLAAATIASPSHCIAMERTDAGLRVRLDKRAFLDRDFVLTLASNTVQSSCIVVPDGDGHVALASLRIPPVPELERQPLALKLIIDCSGSMAGTSIVQTRKAALAILDQLHPGDSFNVTLFGSNYKHFFRTMVPVSARYITEAWNLIDGMDADMGGTEMEKALNAVFALQGEDATGAVLLITDGEIHEHEKLVRQARKSGQRVFAVGVGNSVAETFLRKLANATGGACELVAPQEGMGEFVMSQFHRMRQRRLGKLRIEWPAVQQWQTVLPEPVFAGDTLHVFAGLAQAAAGQVRLTIEGGDDVTAAIAAADNEQIPRLAAARRLDNVAEAEARQLAVRYQLLTRWTNFLVVAEREAKAEDLPETHKVPQMLAAGWGGTGSIAASMCMDMDVGTDALDAFHVPASAKASRAQAMRDTGMGMYDIPCFLRKSADADDVTPPATSDGIPNEQPTAQFAIDTPAGFVAALELELVGLVRQPKLPNRIDELAKCGLPEVIVANLRQLVAKGRDEAEVVAAFVYALSQSGIGDSFGRAFKRAILKDWKQVVPGREIVRVMSYALQEIARGDWNWQAKPFDQLAANLAETT